MRERGTVTIRPNPIKRARHLKEIIPQLPAKCMRGYFFCSDTINATNMPKEIISESAISTSIGNTSFPYEMEGKNSVPNPSRAL